MATSSGLGALVLRALALSHTEDRNPDDLDYSELQKPRFGEVTWVANQVWNRLDDLKNINSPRNQHPGLCITENEQMLAFGSSKTRKFDMTDPRYFPVSPQDCSGLNNYTVFLLFYRLPVSANELPQNFLPAPIPEKLKKELKSKLARLSD